MDPATVVQTLQLSLSPDPQHRAQAEAFVDQLVAQGLGGLSALVRVVGQLEIDPQNRLMAALVVKNHIKHHWDIDTYNPAERGPFRELVAQALFQEPAPTVRVQLAAMWETIVRVEFPNRWPEAYDLVAAQLSAGGDQLRQFNALIALSKILRTLEFRSRDNPDRPALYNIVATSFAGLREMLVATLAADSGDAGLMCRYLLKCYHSAILLVLPPVEPELLVSWIEPCIAVLRKPVPPGTPDPHMAAKEPWWRAKKKASQILMRLFSRYSQGPQADDQDPRYMELISGHHVAILEAFLATMAERGQGAYVSEVVMHQCLLFMCYAIKPAALYQHIKPHTDALLHQLILPLFVLTAEEQAQWSEDPAEFVRREQSLTYEFSSARSAAVQFVVQWARCRRNITDTLLAHVQAVVVAQPPASPLELDAALHVLGAAAGTVASLPRLASQVEGFLAQHVMPLFESPVGVLRRRACWLFRTMHQIPETQPELWAEATRRVLNCLHDAELPVAVEAASVVDKLLERPTVREVVRPVLMELLTTYFRLLENMASDNIVNAIKSVVLHFQDSIAPIAAQLMRQVVSVFQHCLDESAHQDEDDMEDNAAHAAFECSQTCVQILQCCTEVPEAFPELEREFLPVVRAAFSSDELLEFLDAALDGIITLLFFGKRVSPEMWQLFPQIVNACSNYAFDLFEAVASVVDNCIGHDPETFLTGGVDGTPFLTMTMQLVGNTINQPDCLEPNMAAACAVLMSMLHHLPGRLDAVAPSILELVVTRLQTALTDPTKIALLKVVASLVHYDTPGTLAALSAAGATQGVFVGWLQQATVFQGRWDRFMTILAFCDVWRCDPALVPVEVQGLMPTMFEAVIRLTAALRDFEMEMLARVEGEDDLEGEFESHVFEQDESLIAGDDADAADDQMSAFLSQRLNDMAAMHEGLVDPTYDDFTSPLDQIDACAYFFQTFQPNQPLFDQLCSAVTPEIAEGARGCAEEGQHMLEDEAALEG